MLLSATSRKDTIKEITGQKFDLIVIGGGITGAGVALDGASRGINVLLLEKNDFASGTSSKSTKLIHGGLRYLKQLEFGLVRKVGKERAVIYHLAPHLVIPVNMLLPIYKKGSLGRLSTSLALWVYDFLAKVRKEDEYKMLGKTQTQKEEPLLETKGLIGGAVYKEYRTDDARLTLAVIKKAAEYGAKCLSYTEVKDFLRTGEKITGVLVKNKIGRDDFEVHADEVVNAAGPWADELRNLTNEKISKRLFLTKGIHVVAKKEKLPLKHAVYFDVPKDQRMIFAIPRGEIVYIGTTDTAYTGDNEKIPVLQHDITYLLNAVNATFPSAHLKENDIISSWAGLRPLIYEEGKSPSEVSRKDEIFFSEDGLITIAGGKLTGYRKMAMEVVDIAAERLTKRTGKQIPLSKTEHIKLFGADFSIPIEEFIERRTGEAKQVGLNKEVITYLVYNYGTDAEKIIQTAFEIAQKIPNAEKRLLFAELKYCVEHEMTCTLSDFLVRRTGKMYFDKEAVLKNYKQVAIYLQELLELTEVQLQEQVKMFENELFGLFTAS
ncbi:MAG: FAD-dependent oxidoreductase [Chitinophagales bacterium]